ncbi:MAG: polyprenyl synthetase family protein [Chthoniobacterales bacterium]|nr:polyprenyl synthetase family protein [Chthoniobacterales bacterium]
MNPIKAKKAAVDPAALASFKRTFELINTHLYSVEERIRAQARAFDPAMEGYVGYVCGSAGKRLRPALALLAGGSTGKISAAHVDLAVVVELIHIATLVHDDIMDGADLRRDQPTVNAKWGNAISVLLGDALLAHAMRLATNFSDTEVVRRIADAAAEVCTGEIIQTQRRFDLNLSAHDYYRIVEMKTAALFAAASELGAFLSETTPEKIGALKLFGLKLGTAYQIYDDCLDLVGDEEEIGKTLGSDLRKGKLTLPLIFLLQSARRAGDHGELSALLLNGGDTAHEKIAVLLSERRALRQTADAAGALVQEALAALGPVDENRFTAGLRGVAEYLQVLIDRVARTA